MKKIGDVGGVTAICKKLIDRCRHPEHSPPNMIVLQPGVYEHECPGCNEKVIITIRDNKTLFHT